MQRYISKELFHFLGKDKSKEDQYKLLKKILSEHKLGIGKDNTICSGINYSTKLSSNNVYDVQMVCFCDIPINDLEIHMEKYCFFGISFFKSYLIKNGAIPLWYVSKNSKKYLNSKTTYGTYHDFVFKQFLKLKNKTKQDKDIEQFFDYLNHDIFPYMKFFDPKKDDQDRENYYMEREWRIYGTLNFKNFKNICRIILPKKFSAEFRKDFPKYSGQISFSDFN